MKVIVHGGAGGPSDEPADRQAVLDSAAETGAGTDDVTDAVVEAVRVLESDPRFNAGVGSAIQSDGVVRTDAGLMTDDRAAGAACAMPGVEHAVEVARAVKEGTPHVLVAGVHAVDLAEAIGVETDVDLRTEETRERWAEEEPPESFDTDEHLAFVNDRFGREQEADGDDEGDGARHRPDHDTVGAVARDGDRIAAATSTGGRWCALAGRVGDVPQVGSGFYATRAGGASATGAGEDIARVTLARRAVDHLETGRTAADAAELAIEEFEDLTGSTAGVIVLRNDGDHGSDFNSEAMQTAVDSDQ
ncbi:isoaspartyl peptidase/L-asparaginase [Salinirubellus sp. GCM10025818]|jgi:beta-aspartyl-peptidase (threonine type)|uniref:isoaspartyl peptidase/L-asparaginase n=1 Tax=Salinirubellus TaxID=2162630 RepID=UPI0030D1F5CC